MEEPELYVDRLKGGEYKDYTFTIAPDFMESDEQEARFQKNMEIEVSATLTTEHLIFNLSIDTEGENFCKICNKPILQPISIKEKHIDVPLKEVKGGIYSLKPYIRESIYLNMPKYCECEGKCPEREALSKYLKNSEDPEKDN